MIETVALEPAYSPLGEPVTAMTTGKDATLALLDDAISPTDDTVPYTGVVEPPGVMTAWSPTWIWPTSVSSTVVFTVKEPVDTTTMSLLAPLEEELAAEEDWAFAAAPRPLSPDDRAGPPDRSPDPDPPEPLDPPDPELAETSSPTVRLTEATVPAKVAVRLASARLLCALDSCDWADVTAACRSRSGWWTRRWPGRSTAGPGRRKAVAWAAFTSSCRAVGSILARTCPLVTFCPAAT